jgi:hypothetical protein
VLLHLPLHQGDGRRGLAHRACNTSLYCHHCFLDHAKVHAIFWIMTYSCLFPRKFYTWLYSNSGDTFLLIHYNETSQEKKLRFSSDKESVPPPSVALKKIMQKMQLKNLYKGAASIKTNSHQTYGKL